MHLNADSLIKINVFTPKTTTTLKDSSHSDIQNLGMSAWIGVIRRSNLFLYRNTFGKYTRWGQGSCPITHLQKPIKVGLPPENMWPTTAEDKKDIALINTLRVCKMAVLGGMCQIMFGFGPITCDSVKDSSCQLVENGLLSFFKVWHLIPHWLACQILHKVMSQERFKSSSNCQLDCIALYQWD